ncbi:hypothetical protein [Caldalkalibacillus salinus]|uniref:hypothetical protein n=1 Tax=Caldalkalibacillus salinus TaxID=2803787 RepID=UPI001922CEFF|nr:hypothetical protein [Caldalkalibacillus salinus]
MEKVSLSTTIFVRKRRQLDVVSLTIEALNRTQGSGGESFTQHNDIRSQKKTTRRSVTHNRSTQPVARQRGRKFH